MKKLIAFILSLAVSLSLCGCYDSREINETAYVIALGVDKRGDSFNYTFQISMPLAMGGGEEGMSGGGGEENSKVENIVIGAADFYEARSRLDNFLSKQVNLSHLGMIAFSSEVAEEGLESHMNFLLREREVRPHTKVCVTAAKAEAFIRGINPILEANTAEFYDQVARTGSIYAPPKTIREFVNEEALYASAIPVGIVTEFEDSAEFGRSDSDILRVSTSKSEFAGLCLFKDYKSVGYLSLDRSNLFGLLTGEIGECDMEIISGDKSCFVKLMPKSAADFKVISGGEAATVNMYAEFTAEIKSAADITDEDIEAHLNKEAYALFLTAQGAGCDIFGAGDCLRRRCKTISQWEDLNWDEMFAKAYFSPRITVVSERSNTGTM